MSSEFTMTRRVQFSETDMGGVLHFAHYYRWMEEIEHTWFRSMGLSIMSEDQGKRIGWPRVRTSCEYFAPVRFEEEVELFLRLTSLGTRSISHKVLFSREGSRIAIGRTKMVCCTMENGRLESIVIPDSIRTALEYTDTEPATFRRAT